MKIEHHLIGGLVAGLVIELYVYIAFVANVGIKNVSDYSDVLSLYMGLCCIPSLVMGTLGSLILARIIQTISSSQNKNIIGIAILGGILGGILGIVILNNLPW